MDAELDELDRLVRNAVSQVSHDGTEEQTVQQWCKLFAYTSSEAEEAIIAQRAELGRQQISQELWHDIAAEKVAQGYDKEAYEHELWRQGRSRGSYAISNPVMASPKLDGTWGLVLQPGPLSSVEAVKTALETSKALPVTGGTNEDGESAGMVLLTGYEKQSLSRWLQGRGGSFRPIWTKINIAAKVFDESSRHATLGRDATMPQFRFGAPPDRESIMQQDQYTVWYFFYGTLMEPDILGHQIGVALDAIKLQKAVVFGGRLTTWGAYRALIDGEAGDSVKGAALLIQSQAWEDALRAYETSAYEVVRCKIHLDSGVAVHGRTFRFVDSSRQGDK